MPCEFQLAWQVPCKKPSGDERFCEEHLKEKCCSCGKQATAQCDEPIGPLVCGYPVCDDCEHELVENGTTGYQFKHCKKTEQKYTPWYARTVSGTVEPEDA